MKDFPLKSKFQVSDLPEFNSFLFDEVYDEI